MDARLMQTMLAVDEDHWWYRGRRRVIAAALQRLALPSDLAVLDAGCGSGRTLRELARYGRVAAIELDPDAASLAAGRGDYDVRVAALPDVPWPAESFDLITCLDVIEHVEGDVAALAELRRVARPSAVLLVTVPAYPLLWSRHDVANHHFRRYTRRALSTALVAAGWRLRHITSFNALLLAPAAAVRLAQRGRIPEQARVSDLQLGPLWLNRLLELPLHAEASWLRGGRALPFGLSLMTVASND
jgi:SAM-dependent methyltransferase